MTDQEKIEAAAEAYELDPESWLTGSAPYIMIKAFKSAVAWRDANPSEKLMKLVEALKDIKQLGKLETNCPDGIRGCGVLHYKYDKPAEIAREALAAFESETNKQGG